MVRQLARRIRNRGRTRRARGGHTTAGSRRCPFPPPSAARSPRSVARRRQAYWAHGMNRRSLAAPGGIGLRIGHASRSVSSSFRGIFPVADVRGLCGTRTVSRGQAPRTRHHDEIVSPDSRGNHVMVERRKILPRLDGRRPSIALRSDCMGMLAPGAPSHQDHKAAGSPGGPPKSGFLNDLGLSRRSP